MAKKETHPSKDDSIPAKADEEKTAETQAEAAKKMDPLRHIDCTGGAGKGASGPCTHHGSMPRAWEASPISISMLDSTPRQATRLKSFWTLYLEKYSKARSPIPEATPAGLSWNP